MAIPYMRQSDVAMRLHDTMCLYKGVPVYVSVNENFDSNVIQIKDFSKHINSVKCDLETINVADDNFNITDIELGYVNVGSKAVYCTRIPCRKQKQGLTYSSLKVSDNSFSVDTVFYCQGLYDTIVNKFPCKEDAIHSVVSKEATSCAFSRNFCIDRPSARLITLNFRGRTVALYSTRDGRFTALPDLKDYSLIMKYAHKHNISL